MSNESGSSSKAVDRRAVLRGGLAASGALLVPATPGAAPAFALSGRPGAPWGSRRVM